MDALDYFKFKIREGEEGRRQSEDPSSRSTGQDSSGAFSKENRRGAVSRAVSRARSKMRQGRDADDGVTCSPGRSGFRSRTPVRLNGKGKKAHLGASPQSLTPESVELGPSRGRNEVADWGTSDDSEEMDIEIIESSLPSSPTKGDHFEEVDLEEEHKQAVLLRDAIEAKLRGQTDKLVEEKSTNKPKATRARGPIPPEMGIMPPAPRAICVAVTGPSPGIPPLEKFAPAGSHGPTQLALPGSSIGDNDKEEDGDGQLAQPEVKGLQIEFILPRDQQQQSLGAKQEHIPPATGYDPNLLELAEFGGEQAVGGHFKVIQTTVVFVTEEKDESENDPGELQTGMKLLFGELLVLDINSLAGNDFKYYQLSLKPNQKVRISPSGKFQLELMEPLRVTYRRRENGESVTKEVLRYHVHDESAQSEQKQHVLIPHPDPVTIFQKRNVTIATTRKRPFDDIRLKALL